MAAVCHGERNGSDVTVVLDRMAVWQGTKAKPVDLNAVEEWLVVAGHTYNRAKLVIDPWQSVGIAQRLRRPLRVREFAFVQQSVGRLAMTLHTAIRDRHLALPDAPALIDELANFPLRETSPGVLRMDHDSDKHDDRAIAIALAAHHIFEIAGYSQGAAFIEGGESSPSTMQTVIAKTWPPATTVWPGAWGSIRWRSNAALAATTGSVLRSPIAPAAASSSTNYSKWRQKGRPHDLAGCARRRIDVLHVDLLPSLAHETRRGMAQDGSPVRPGFPHRLPPGPR